MAKMNIFISWSGPRSRAAAGALCGWLPQIANGFKPWMSTEILKGARWRTEIAAKLAGTTVGIICLTRANLESPWLLFEAGAISKATENSFACTFLLDGLRSGDIADPLGQFQHTEANKDEIFKLAKNLNDLLPDEDRLTDTHLAEAFQMWWPKLDQALNSLPPDQTPKLPQRDDRELLLESIELARETNALVRARLRRPTPPPPPPEPDPVYAEDSPLANYTPEILRALASRSPGQTMFEAMKNTDPELAARIAEVAKAIEKEKQEKH